MPCYNPTRVVMAGDHRLHWDKDWRYATFEDGWTVCNVNCRTCIGCNMATAREWSIRAFHEAQLHTQHWTDQDTKITTEIPNSSVITLTYDDEHMPPNGELLHDDFQRFMKRLRSRRSRREKKSISKTKPIRYFMCGEYGGKTGRCHFHCVVFGECFDDQYTEVSLDGQVHQMSYELDDLWKQSANGDDVPSKIGRATVDTFTFAGAGYVAGYVAKKSTAEGVHLGPTKTEVDGHGVVRCIPIAPEYRMMSNRPGIGAPWILKPENMAAVYDRDEIKISEWTFHPPKYYDLLLDRTRPDLTGEIIRRRQLAWGKSSSDWTPARCAAAEQIALDNLQARRDSL